MEALRDSIRPEILEQVRKCIIRNGAPVEEEIYPSHEGNRAQRRAAAAVARRNKEFA